MEEQCSDDEVSKQNVFGLPQDVWVGHILPCLQADQQCGTRALVALRSSCKAGNALVDQFITTLRFGAAAAPPTANLLALAAAFIKRLPCLSTLACNTGSPPLELWLDHLPALMTTLEHPGSITSLHLSSCSHTPLGLPTLTRVLACTPGLQSASVQLHALPVGLGDALAQHCPGLSELRLHEVYGKKPDPKKQGKDKDCKSKQQKGAGGAREEPGVYDDEEEKGTDKSSDVHVDSGADTDLDSGSEEANSPGSGPGPSALEAEQEAEAEGGRRGSGVCELPLAPELLEQAAAALDLAEELEEAATGGAPAADAAGEDEREDALPAAVSAAAPKPSAEAAADAVEPVVCGLEPVLRGLASLTGLERLECRQGARGYEDHVLHESLWQRQQCLEAAGALTGLHELTWTRIGGWPDLVPLTALTRLTRLCVLEDPYQALGCVDPELAQPAPPIPASVISLELPGTDLKLGLWENLLARCSVLRRCRFRGCRLDPGSIPQAPLLHLQSMCFSAMSTIPALSVMLQRLPSLGQLAASVTLCPISHAEQRAQWRQLVDFERLLHDMGFEPGRAQVALTLTLYRQMDGLLEVLRSTQGPPAGGGGFAFIGSSEVHVRAMPDLVGASEVLRELLGNCFAHSRNVSVSFATLDGRAAAAGGGEGERGGGDARAGGGQAELPGLEDALIGARGRERIELSMCRGLDAPAVRRLAEALARTRRRRGAGVGGTCAVISVQGCRGVLAGAVREELSCVDLDGVIVEVDHQWCITELKPKMIGLYG